MEISLFMNMLWVLHVFSYIVKFISRILYFIAFISVTLKFYILQGSLSQ